jgi:hypothetical protein
MVKARIFYDYTVLINKMKCQIQLEVASREQNCFQNWQWPPLDPGISTLSSRLIAELKAKLVLFLTCRKSKTGKMVRNE